MTNITIRQHVMMTDTIIMNNNDDLQIRTRRGIGREEEGREDRGRGDIGEREMGRERRRDEEWERENERAGEMGEKEVERRQDINADDI